MVLTWTSPAAGRRRFIGGLVLTLEVFAVSVVPALAQAAPAQAAPAQAAPAQAAPAQAAPAPQARVFTGDAGIMYNVIKPDKTADFEMVVGKLKEALAKSTNPIRKQQAAGWRVFKQPEPLPNGNILYVFFVDPTVKDADYTVSRILAEVFPVEVQELFKVYSGAFAGGVTLANWSLVNDLGK
jgi:hypothetical protein